MAIREVVDRRIEVEGEHHYLQFRCLDSGRVHVTAIGPDLGLPIPLGEFSLEDLRDALAAVEVSRGASA